MPTFSGFLGTWVLIPESCEYQQGEAPRSGTYRITADGDRVTFHIDWVDSDGEAHDARFSGVADGQSQPFDGGDLADAMTISCPSERELNSSASYRGVERMVAQRQLDKGGNAMRVTQVVRFQDGTYLANIAIYRKQVLN